MENDGVSRGEEMDYWCEKSSYINNFFKFKISKIAVKTIKALRW